MQAGWITNSWKSPIVWMLLVFTVVSYTKQTENGFFDYTIRSDGSGYYAYLPTLFIYQDPTFEKAKQAEAYYHQGNTSNYFLFKTEGGKLYNKYFPGLAVLQLPFFVLACIFAKLSGSPIDGYGPIFQFFFWFGSLFYALAGTWFLQQFLRMFLKKTNHAFSLILPLFFLATPLVFYCFFTPSFTHVYSFFLFAVCLWLLLKLRQTPRTKWMVMLGGIAGLIVLLRPTNLVFFLAAPMLWTSGKEFVDWLKTVLRENKRGIALMLTTFFIFLSLLFLLWKWQTGEWIVWSYSGEGFDFLHPPLFSTLFSFRSGLFLHTPVMILVIIGWYSWYSENRFQAVWWGIYAVVNAWIIFSWWCWDYESSFGNRPFTEHLAVLILPLFFLLKSRPKLVYAGLIAFACIGSVRLYNHLSGRMSDQRFTKENYVASLAFWETKNAGRWYFTRSCEPHGSVILEQELFAQPEIHEVKAEEEFLFTASYPFPEKRRGARYYVRVTLDKKVVSPEPFENVFLVIDAAKEGVNHRFYKSIDLFNDKEEGRGEWKSLVFESQVYDFLEEYDQFTVYIWNAGKHRFQLKNVHYSLQVYR